ncbi:MAG: hypothetical protein ACFE0S_11820 [Rhodospirillales bacterium]
MNRDLFRNVDFDNSEEVGLDALDAQLAACLAYWRGLGAGGRLPAWKDVDMVALPPDVLPLVTVVDIDWNRGIVDADALAYRFWGTGHVQAKNIERTGSRISEHSNRTPVVEAEYLKVIEHRQPMAFRKNILIEDPLRAVLQTSVRLPLSNDGVRVDNVLSASVWDSIKVLG